MRAAPGWDGKHSEWGEPSSGSVKRRQGDRVPLASTPVPDGAAFNVGDAERAVRRGAACRARQARQHARPRRRSAQYRRRALRERRWHGQWKLLEKLSGASGGG